ncbi:M28 family metallopeptidase [Sporosarcina oncorhynchi]|uniref:M28 family metallopeptidase n=1 Tax=Sporosarcina oncorhynchi TaxID=3056444 RepID=A0ABZ0L367_9BACL|nr:M28 family metallopeptidase [Sporosarcina sp. T2O-4]WOV87051.1 M28 family metallopeptidase [Sporosarcina sp. T2O-4]
MIHLCKVFIGAILMTIFLAGCSEEADYAQLEETIRILTSDEMDGRLTGTKGNDLALSFIEEKYQELGLEPISSDTGKLLLPYPHKFHDPEKGEYQIQIISESGVETDLIRGVDFLERSGYSSYEKTLPITFDIESPEIEQAYVVLKDRSNFQEAFEKSQGVFIVEEVFSKTLSIDTVDKPHIQISQKTYDRLKEISSGQIMMYSSVKEEMIDAYNVAGKIPGKDNKNAIVLSAHFDHVGWVGDTIYRGAIDNASGVAVLLEIAEKLADSVEEFDSDIIIVAFNGEESELQGSSHFIEELGDKYNSIYNINLDSFYKTPVSIVSQEDEVSEDLLGDLISVLKENSVEFNTDLSGGLRSDHSTFLSKHINAMTISSQNVTPIIHRPLDTIEEIDFISLLKVADSIVEFINKHHRKEYVFTQNYDPENSTSQVGEEVDYEFQATERAKLQHNEYTLKRSTKDKNYHLIDNSDFTFTDLHEFKEYYSTIDYESIIEEYHINSIRVFNSYFRKIDVSKLEEDKVYTHDLSSDDLLWILFSYSSIHDEKQKLLVEIRKETSMEDKELVYKEMVINGIPYTLSYSENSDHLFGFSYNQVVNGLTYTVSFRKGEEVVSEFESHQVTGIKSSLSEEDITALIEDINIQEMVLKTLKSF